MTTLEAIAGGAPALPLAMIGGDEALARQVQKRLAAIGLLDPPDDGAFGPVSQWALQEFVRYTGVAQDRLDASVAEALLDDDAHGMLPLHPGANLAGRVVRALQAKGWWICRHPDAVNIVYVEGMNLDGRDNANTPNQFNDARLLLRISVSGEPQLAGAWQATTEPGRFYTESPLSPLGAARIAFGQYKAWSVGMHGKSDRHQALVQTANITVCRDKNRDFMRDGDVRDTGVFAVNQHWGYDMKQSDIGNASAGCLVGRLRAGHREFMALCKADPRFVANNGYRFMAAVLPVADVPD
ncbi:peptidoglycan-binding domain-containing protein [Caenimonas aquaedulcis]|uniref:Peptidoglycan-binding protein n=1 Tax=Caenimonas aquaedulcis TaxID=2793270 RepID=A0A931H175_9BURK|nr:peptidoglycan-binding domain-containing protein [Caenimonas aquaedulcis]MBG9386655.1 peptidoglycan-binding protein [Caenimonas aquaedulcis]